MRLSLLARFRRSAPATDADCAEIPQPVVSIAIPSRYAAGSTTRSTIDETANAEVNAALQPVDEFVRILATQTSQALRLSRLQEVDKARALADCVLSGLGRWAKADALSRLQGTNAKLAIPSRMGGAAFAYGLAVPLSTPDSGQRKLITDWLTRRATETMTFFDDPTTMPRSARNNLRMWAALSVLRTGIEVRDAAMIDWADRSFRVALCHANPDGSLPLEMQRGQMALHYQLHAMIPMVVGAALLRREGSGLHHSCATELCRLVGFTLAAVETPDLVAAHAGVAQKRKAGKATFAPHELAWIPAWQSLSLAPDLGGYAPPGMVLAHSKLGGNQTEIWEGRDP